MLASEAANIGAALSFAQAQADTEIQLRLLTAANAVFDRYSLDEYANALRAALQKPPADAGLQGHAQSALARVEYRRGNYAAARAAAERALELGEQATDSAIVASALNVLGGVAVAAGDFPLARELYQRALETCRAATDDHGVAIALINLGDVALVAGEYERAIDLSTEAMELMRARGDTPAMEIPLINLAAAHAHLGHLEEAEEAAALSLTVATDLRDPIAVGAALLVFAAVAASRDDGERAALPARRGRLAPCRRGAGSDPSQVALREEVLRRIQTLNSPRRPRDTRSTPPLTQKTRSSSPSAASSPPPISIRRARDRPPAADGGGPRRTPPAVRTRGAHRVGNRRRAGSVRRDHYRLRQLFRNDA